MLTQEEVREICDDAVAELGTAISKGARASINDMFHIMEHDRQQRARIEELEKEVADLRGKLYQAEHTIVCLETTLDSR